MTTAAVHKGHVGGFESLVLENARLRVVVIPALGGRVWELHDKVRGRQWIWHRGDVPLAASPVGASYDDVWAGGWEELFPNDAPGPFEGRDLPDHGEWWARSWSVDDISDGDAAHVRLSMTTAIVRAACVKEFHLGRDDDAVSIAYRIRSAEPAPYHFLFKQHLPIQVTPACRLLVPGGIVHPVDTSFGTLLTGPGPYAWPARGGTAPPVADLGVIPDAAAGAREFVYVTDLPEPWCGVEDREREASLRMTFDGAAFPYLWLFLSYGGWRGINTAVLEPCTNMPKDLHEAVRLGRAARLLPGEEWATTVSVSLGGLVEPAP